MLDKNCWNESELLILRDPKGQAFIVTSTYDAAAYLIAAWPLNRRDGDYKRTLGLCQGAIVGKRSPAVARKAFLSLMQKTFPNRQ